MQRASLDSVPNISVTRSPTYLIDSRSRWSDPCVRGIRSATDYDIRTMRTSMAPGAEVCTSFLMPASLLQSHSSMFKPGGTKGWRQSSGRTPHARLRKALLLKKKTAPDHSMP